jgi:hypothetical protein
MIRHETRPTQTATQPLRTARDVAPICCQAPATDAHGHICTPKSDLVSTFIAPHDLGDAPPAFGQCPPKVGQIQKYP